MTARPASLLALLMVATLACSGLPFLSTPTPVPTATPPPTSTPTPAPIPTLAPTAVLPPTAVQLPTALIEPLAQEYAVPDEGQNHIPEGEPGTYSHYPPSSGEHYPKVLQWDYYDVDLPLEYYVHNLEHGGIVVLYNCPAACPDTVATLGEFIDQAPPEDVFGEVKVLIGANKQIESKVVALAWGYELDLPEADLALLLDFYRRHVNQGPELAP